MSKKHLTSASPDYSRIPSVDRMIYTGGQPYYFDGVDVLPVTAFLPHLHQGQIF